MNVNEQRDQRDRAFLASMLVAADGMADTLKNLREAFRCIEEWGDQLPPALAGEIANQVDGWLKDVNRLRGELAARSKTVAPGVM